MHSSRQAGLHGKVMSVSKRGAFSPSAVALAAAPPSSRRVRVHLQTKGVWLRFQLPGLGGRSCSPCCGSEVFLHMLAALLLIRCSDAMGAGGWGAATSMCSRWGRTEGPVAVRKVMVASLLPAPLLCWGRSRELKQSLCPLDVPPGYRTGDIDTASACGSRVVFSGRMQTARRWRV